MPYMNNISLNTPVSSVESRLERLTHCYWLVGVAALFLGGCATPLTVSTAPPPEPPVERWRGLTVAAEHRCSPYHSDEYAYPQAVED